uniref:Uncharacterized protein n=1 Tax=Arundo donax TaxID=35708 RepID=A0A0A9G730_ARUDO
MEELEARFAALKGAAAGPEEKARVRLEDLGGESSEDEVDKVMRWAMDAARLDVASPGVASGGGKAKRAEEDEEEKDEESSASGEDDDDEERLQLEMARKRKEMSKGKSKNKWFFF